MTKNRIQLYWLLLSVLLFTASILTTIGEAQARYDTTVSGNTLVEHTVAGVQSNYLVTGQDAPMTVLVGQIPLESSAKVTFWVKSSGENTKGKLAWSVKEEAYANYLNVSVMSGLDVVDPTEDIELLKDVEMDFNMTITPSSLARSTAHEALKLHVLVTWGEDMWGTFQVLLPEVKAPEEETTAAPSQPAAVSEGETTETTETTAATEPTETTAATAPTETTAATESTETTEPAPTPAEIGMATIKSFAQAEALPVKLALTRDVTTVKLGLWVEEPVEETAEDGTVTQTTQMVLSAFPEGTRFSVNGGESYYMLTDSRIVELDLNNLTELSVLLDFSHAEIVQEEKLRLAMEAWAGETLLASRDASTTADVSELFQVLTHTLVQTAQETESGETTEATEATEATETTAPTTVSAITGWQCRVLNQSNCLELVLPLHWWDADLQYSVDILTLTEAGIPEYRPVTLSADGLSAKRTTYGGVHNLVFQIGQTLPQAGTYRVNMTWKYKDICFAKTQTTFFINYSALTAYTLGS